MGSRAFPFGEGDNLSPAARLIFGNGFLGHVDGLEERPQSHDALDGHAALSVFLADMNKPVGFDGKVWRLGNEQDCIEIWHNAPPEFGTSERNNSAASHLNESLIILAHLDSAAFSSGTYQPCLEP